MKTNYLKTIGSFLLLATIAVFPSCKKEVSDGGRSLTGGTNVRIVNAKQGTYPVDLYLTETRLNLLPVSYGSPTGYFTTNAGKSTAHFNTSETQELVVTAPVDFAPNGYYTVYLTGNTSMYVTTDEMTAPPAGSARVRFINLSNTAPQTVDVGYTGGAKFITGLTYQNISTYVNANPSLGISIYAAGSTTPTLSIPAATLQSGRIYTVYVNGSTNVTYNIIAQN